jgi:hypothetical protein
LVVAQVSSESSCGLCVLSILAVIKDAFEDGKNNNNIMKIKEPNGNVLNFSKTMPLTKNGCFY